MDVTNSPKNFSSSQKIPQYNQESLTKYFSNRTITESNEDQIFVKYFNKDPKEKCNIDVECVNNQLCMKTINQEKAYPILNKNEIINSNLAEDNQEFLASTNDPNLNFCCKSKICDEKKGNKQTLRENSDNESSSYKEILEKTNVEILSNESITERNIRANTDLNLNLNENDNLSLTNDNFNNNSNKNTNLNESKKQEDEKSNNTNSKNKGAIANRRRGRQKKNVRNKKDEQKGKDELSSVKPASECISTISRKLFVENSWVHLSCALWIPEVLIEDFEKKENIKSKN